MGHDVIAFHLHRKPFAYSFLSGIAPLCFTSVGNLLQTVSCPTWLHCVSHQQETFRKQFPVRHDSTAFHLYRKLFAYSFLSGIAPLRFTSVGNLLRMVSYSAWPYCVSPRQETFRIQFPVCHGSIVFHTNRKLFAYSFLSGIAPLCFTSVGNFSPMVSYSAWPYCVSPRQETFRP
mgnify:CR=1 FL=1